MSIVELYQKIYNDLIQKRIDNPISKDKQYCECHHIVPKCIGGTNDKSNLVNLTAREHFIAHMLLARIYRDTEHYYKLLCAVTYMTNKHGKMRKNSTLVINSKTYDIVRNELSKIRIGYFKRLPLKEQENISKAFKKLQEKRARKVICVETNIVYDSVKDAVRKTGILAIRRVCTGKRITAGGFHFRYVDENLSKNFPVKEKLKNRKPIIFVVNQKPIYCVELNKSFISLHQCAISMFSSPYIKSYIRDVANNKRENYRGFHFKWIDKV